MNRDVTRRNMTGDELIRSYAGSGDHVAVLVERFEEALKTIAAQEDFINSVKDRVETAHEKSEAARLACDAELLSVENYIGELCNELEEHEE